MPSQHVLTLITWNIHHAEGLDRRLSVPRIAGVIRDVQPHVACIQEVDCRVLRTRRAHQPRELARLLKMKALYGPTLKWPLGARYGNLLLTRLPMDAPHIHPLPGSGEARGLVEMQVRTEAGSIAVFCTHWGLSEEDRVLQAASTVEVMRRLTIPALLAGDFNEEPDGPAHEILRDSGLVPLGVHEPTFPADDPKIHIDHVYGTPGWRVREAFTIPSLASDHRPVVAELVLMK